MRHRAMRLRRAPVEALAALALFAGIAAAREVRGVVVLADGAPAAGARVRAYYSHDASGYGSRWLAETVTDAEGRFSLDLPDFSAPPVVFSASPPLRTWLVATPGGEPAALCLAYPDQDDGYRLVSGHGRALDVRVRTSANQPAAGAQVAIRRRSSPRAVGATRLGTPEGAAPFPPEVYVAVADAEGRARLEAAPEGDLGLVASHPEHGVGVGLAREGAAEAGVTLTFLPERLRGTVAAPGAEVLVVVPSALWSWDVAGGWTTAGEGGRFELDVLLSARRAEGPVRWVGREVAQVLFLDPAPEPQFALASQPLLRPGARLSATLSPGVLLRVRAALPDGRPLAGATVSASPVGRFATRPTVYRVTDAEGAVAFRLPRGGVRVALAQAPATFLPPAQPVEAEVDLREADATVSLQADLRPAARLEVSVSGPDGRPAAGALVLPLQPDGHRSGATTDDLGVAVLTGLAAGQPLELHVISQDRALGAVHRMEAPNRPFARTDVHLAPARTGEVRLVDGNGNPLRGFVSLYLAAQQDVALFTGATAEGGGAVRVPGLVPDVDYAVLCAAPEGPRVRAAWRIEAADAAPRLIVTVNVGPAPRPGRVPPARPARPGRPAAPPRTPEDFQRDVEAITDARWKEPDPFEKHLTWYAGPTGIVLADAEALEVRRFPGLFGYDRIEARGVVFTRDKVWLATDRGLLAYDRETRSWNRYAVGGLFVEVPIERIEAADGGALRLTVAMGDAPPRAFDFDPAAERWTEVP